MGIEYKRKIYDKFIKRVIDIIVAAIAIVFLSPIMIAVALCVRVKLGAPIFFHQPRPGLNEKVFTMYKFRTMLNKEDENGNILPDEQRLTKFGKMLRSTSLDELPELFNILKGDMSVVGPRPLLVKYLTLYDEKQSRRHLVKPGITGYAQVNGRNAITWEEKFEKDVFYVENISFLLDLKIIAKTISTVLKKEGISSGTSATMEEFIGTQEDKSI